MSLSGVTWGAKHGEAESDQLGRGFGGVAVRWWNAGPAALTHAASPEVVVSHGQQPGDGSGELLAGEWLRDEGERGREEVALGGWEPGDGDDG